MHGMEFRPFYLAREWVADGHQVLIVAGSHSHLRRVQPDVGGQMAREVLSGINYVWLRTPKYSGNGVQRLLNILAFTRGLRKCGCWMFFRPDVVIASSTHPLDVSTAKSIATRYGAKLIWEIHDLWPRSPIELSGISPWHPFMAWLQWAENRACRAADQVVSILPNTKEYLCEHGLDGQKFHHIPNGVDIGEWSAYQPTQNLPRAISEAIDTAHRDGRVVVLYAGSHGTANALRHLVDAAAMLQGHRVAIVLVGDGPLRAGLIDRAKALKASNISFHPPVPKCAIPELLRQADILYLGWENHPLYRFGICPNKMLDYMMSAKPILHSVSAGNDPVAEAKCGVSVPAGRADLIAEAIMKMSFMPRHALQELGESGRRFAVENHSYKSLAQKFLEILT